MSGGRSDAENEFLAEAQELVEGMSRDLLLLDQSMREGEPSPDLLNGLFRGVHTLKGLSGMFGFHTDGRLAHGLEDLLDHVRLGRATLDPRGSRASPACSPPGARPARRLRSTWRTSVRACAR